jgi:hypothetical protein
MKMFRIVVTCAVALVAGHVCAQEQPAPPVSAQTAQDVGGVTDASRSDAGAPRGMTRQQVYHLTYRLAACAATSTGRGRLRTCSLITYVLFDGTESFGRPVAAKPRIRAEFTQARRAVHECGIEPMKHFVRFCQPRVKLSKQER